MRSFVALLIAVLFYATPVDARMLIGMIQYYNVEGRIGVRISHSGKVNRVHPHSPAETAGIQAGDIIVSVDGHKDVSKIQGTPGTLVNLTVKRDQDEFAVDVPRVDFREIE